jgi:predicted N-formylglutamate amidohydrolase
MQRLKMKAQAVNTAIASIISKPVSNLKRTTASRLDSGRVLRSLGSLIIDPRRTVMAPKSRAGIAARPMTNSNVRYAVPQEFGLYERVTVRASLLRMKIAFARPFHDANSGGTKSRRTKLPQCSFPSLDLECVAPAISSVITHILNGVME